MIAAQVDRELKKEEEQKKSAAGDSGKAFVSSLVESVVSHCLLAEPREKLLNPRPKASESVNSSHYISLYTCFKMFHI